MNSKKQNNFLFIGIKKLLKKSTIYRQIQRKKSLRKTRALVDILHSSGIIVEKERTEYLSDILSITIVFSSN